MPSDATSERVGQLLAKAEESKKAGRVDDIFKALKEASALDPTNSEVTAALVSLQSSSQGGDASALLTSYLETNEAKLGQQALQQLKSGSLAPDSAVACLDILLVPGNNEGLLDDLTAQLLTASIDARKVLAARLQTNATVLFDALFLRGPESFHILTGLPLEDSAWSSSKDQKEAQRDIFQLCVAKLMLAGVDHPERPMKAIARLLAVVPENVSSVVDADVFAVILDSLDIREDNSLRSQAMLATAKVLEATREQGEALFAHFITATVAKQTNDDLIVAFSAAAAAFPMIPAVAAKLFLTDGFIQQLVPTLERNSGAVEKGHRKSSKLERAALELLSAACVDKACRDAISKHCSKWLRDLTNDQTGTHKALAALILAKIDGASQDEITAKLVGFVLEDDDETNQAVEGLAYTTLQPRVKEHISADEKLLKRLVQRLAEQQNSAFGYLTVFYNLVSYRPPRTEEQKKIAQLKAYANQAKPEPDDPLDNDSHVTARARKLLDADVVPALANFSKHTSSPTNVALIVQILLAISREQKHRAKMAQQSAVRVLLQLRDRISSSDKPASEITLVARRAAHAVARLLISVNPAHVFSSGLPATSAVSAIVPLLTPDEDSEHRDLLPTFEALLALTNLASMEDSSARDLLIRAAFDKVEDLMFASNVLVQRASVELVCNLMMAPSGVAKFADGSRDATRRMQILLALADVEDMATRRAAGGALAMLTEWDAAATAVLDKERGLEVLLTMCLDDSDELKHRALVCLLNLVNMPGDLGKRSVAQIKASRGGETIKEALKNSRDPNVLSTGVEVLKTLT